MNDKTNTPNKQNTAYAYQKATKLDHKILAIVYKSKLMRALKKGWKLSNIFICKNYLF